MKIKLLGAAALMIAFGSNIALAEDAVAASFQRMQQDQRVAFDALRGPMPSPQAFDPYRNSAARSEPRPFEIRELSFRRMLEDQRAAFDEIRPRAMSVGEFYGGRKPLRHAMAPSEAH